MTFKTNIGAMVLAATAIGGFAATPAMANHRYNDSYNDGYRYSNYDNRDYREEQRDNYQDRQYNDRQYNNGYQRCGKGTGGTIIGAVAGGLLGNQVARRGNRTEGSIIGAAVGALAGRALAKSSSDCNRRYR